MTKMHRIRMNFVQSPQMPRITQFRLKGDMRRTGAHRTLRSNQRFIANHPYKPATMTVDSKVMVNTNFYINDEGSRYRHAMDSFINGRDVFIAPETKIELVSLCKARRELSDRDCKNILNTCKICKFDHIDIHRYVTKLDLILYKIVNKSGSNAWLRGKANVWIRKKRCMLNEAKLIGAERKTKLHWLYNNAHNDIKILSQAMLLADTHEVEFLTKDGDYQVLKESAERMCKGRLKIIRPRDVSSG